jgi:hypothetical protein
MAGGDWQIGLNLKKKSKGSDPKQFGEVAELPVDYILPNSCRYGQEAYHAFNDITRKSFGQTLRKKIRDWQKDPNPVRGDNGTGPLVGSNKLVANEVPALVSKAVASGGFDLAKMPDDNELSQMLSLSGGNGVLYLQNFSRKLSADLIQKLRNHVKRGGGVMIAENRGKIGKTDLAAIHPFPEVGTYGAGSGKSESFAFQRAHPSIMGFYKGDAFTSDACKGGIFEPGPKGRVMIRTASGDPVFVVAPVGKGRVILSNLVYDQKTEFNETEQTLLLGALKWLARA